MRKNPSMELQLDKIFCLTLRHYPGTNSCNYTWLLPAGLKNSNKRQNRFKIDKQKCDLNMIKYAA